MFSCTPRLDTCFEPRRNRVAVRRPEGVERLEHHQVSVPCRTAALSSIRHANGVSRIVLGRQMEPPIPMTI